MSKFDASLCLGQIGENLFYQAHQGIVEKLDGLQSDFRLIETGQGIELKTDYWAMSDTKNYFMELYSNKQFRTLGGPWQALRNGSNVFVYLYIKDLTFFQFQTDQLVERLNDIIETIAPMNVYNSTYITQGYLVPRDLLKDIATEHTLEIKVHKK